MIDDGILLLSNYLTFSYL